MKTQLSSLAATALALLLQFVVVARVIVQEHVTICRRQQRRRKLNATRAIQCVSSARCSSDSPLMFRGSQRRTALGPVS